MLKFFKRCCAPSKLFLLVATIFLSGCKAVLLNSKGMIGVDEKNLILTALCLMLIVVVPVIVLTVYFSMRYRVKNRLATYLPDWAHSNLIEFVMWSIPIVIIIILASITWVTTHKLDPYRPLTLPGKPVNVQVVALNWKWLFIYPDYHVASVNYLEIPVNRPINFRLTADAPMNSFMIPQLGGQIYTMTGMQTKLHLVANHRGLYQGLSTNFSGEGFTGMTFKARATNDKTFERWISRLRMASQHLTIAEYNTLAKPSSFQPVSYYSTVSTGLFQDVINKYMMPGMRDEKNNLKAMTH